MKAKLRKEEVKASLSAKAIKSWTKGTAVEVSHLNDTRSMLKAANLDWELEMSETFYGSEGNMKSPCHTVYRKDTGEFFFHAKERTVWQNDETVDSFRAFAEKAGLKLNYLGYLHNSNHLIYGAAKIPFDMAPAIDPRDRSDCYLLLSEGHNVGRALRVGVYVIRLVCTNGQIITMPVKQKKIVHRYPDFPVKLVNSYVNASIQALHQHKQEIDLLAETEMSQEEAIVHLINYFSRKRKSATKESDDDVKTCLRLFQGGAMGSHFESVKNTAFGLFHAVSEVENHYVNKHTAQSSDVAQMQSLLAGAKARRLQNLQKELVRVSVGVF